MRYDKKEQALKFIATIQAYRWNFIDAYCAGSDDSLANAMFDTQDTITNYVADRFFDGSYYDTVHTVDDMVHYDGTEFVVTC